MGLVELLIIVILIGWLVGAFVYPVGGSLIHLLLLVCLIVIIIRVIQGRTPLP